MLLGLITKFGGPKVAVACFLAGASLSLPAAWATHSLWNGAVKSSKIKTLEKTNEKQAFTIELQDKTYKEAIKIIDLKDKEIKSLNESNRTYAESNMMFAASRAPVIERITEVGNEIKQDVSLTDKCAVTRINDKLRIYGNGSDFSASSLSSFGKIN